MNIPKVTIAGEEVEINPIVIENDIPEINHITVNCNTNNNTAKIELHTNNGINTFTVNTDYLFRAHAEMSDKIATLALRKLFTNEKGE